MGKEGSTQICKRWEILKHSIVVTFGLHIDLIDCEGDIRQLVSPFNFTGAETNRSAHEQHPLGDYAIRGVWVRRLAPDKELGESRMFSSRIRILRNATSLRWSCNTIKPLSALAKRGSPASRSFSLTAAFHSGLPTSACTTSLPFNQCSREESRAMIRE